MDMNVHYSRLFRRQYKKLQWDLREKTKARIHMLLEHEFNPVLNNHALHKEYEGCRSINVTGDRRIIYKKHPGGIFHLMAVGTHSELYGR